MKVIDSMGSAINRTSWLFTPFNAANWARFGFIAFLAALASGGGGGGGGNIPSGGPPTPGGQDWDISEFILDARDWIVENLATVVFVGVLLFSLGIIFGLLISWLGSRGQVMLVRAVATGRPEIKENWSAMRHLGDSAWRFRIGMMIVGALINIPLSIVAIVILIGIAATGENDIWPYVLGLLPIIIATIFFGIAYYLVNIIFGVFVIPLMYQRNQYALDSWSTFGQMARGNIIAMLLLLLVRLAYYVAFGFASMIVGLLTCCVGFLPIVFHILFAPFFVFDRSYTLYAIQSLGPEYIIFEQDKPQGFDDTTNDLT